MSEVLIWIWIRIHEKNDGYGSGKMMRILWIRIRIRNTDYNGVRLSQELSRVPSSAISKKLKEALKHIAMETKTGFSLFTFRARGAVQPFK